MKMAVRPARIGQSNRGSVSIGKQQVSAPITYPAPKLGLVTTADVASQQPGSSLVMRNFLPTLTGCKIRGGSVKKGLAVDGDDIKSAFKYKWMPLKTSPSAGFRDSIRPA